jgi:hypothetical protein
VSHRRLSDVRKQLDSKSSWALVAFSRRCAVLAERARNPALEIRFDALNEIPLIPFATLEAPPFNGLRWSIQASGIEIPDSIADELDATLSSEECFALDPDTSIGPFQEGSQRLRQHLVTERDSEAAAEKRADIPF